MKVIHKESKEVYKVFDIKYTKNSYPKFLIYDKNEWKVVSAKYFMPYENTLIKG